MCVVPSPSVGTLPLSCTAVLFLVPLSVCSHQNQSFQIWSLHPLNQQRSSFNDLKRELKTRWTRRLPRKKPSKRKVQDLAIMANCVLMSMTTSNTGVFCWSDISNLKLSFHCVYKERGVSALWLQLYCFCTFISKVVCTYVNDLARCPSFLVLIKFFKSTILQCKRVEVTNKRKNTAELIEW